MMTIVVERIKQLLREKKITQKIMLEELDINKNQISRWEDPEAVIKPVFINAIADYLGTTTAYLLGKTDIKEKTPKTESINAENAFGTITMSVTEEEEKIMISYRKHPELHAAIRRMLEIEESDKKEKAVNLPVRVAARSGKDYSIDGEEDTEIKVL